MSNYNQFSQQMVPGVLVKQKLIAKRIIDPFPNIMEGEFRDIVEQVDQVL